VSWWVTIENEVIKLDWANGYISYQSSPAEQRTVEVWVKVNDLSSYRQISVGNAWTWWRNEFAIWTNWEIRFIFPDETWDVRNFVSWNWVITAWQEYHIIFSRLSTWTYLRVNWVDVNITSISASDNVYTWTYFLWAKADLSQYNPIEIKWFRTYTRQLTTQEAIDCYNAWPNSYTPIWDWLAIQLSGKHFAWTEASPTTIYDMKHICYFWEWELTWIRFVNQEFVSNQFVFWWANKSVFIIIRSSVNSWVWLFWPSNWNWIFFEPLNNRIRMRIWNVNNDFTFSAWVLSINGINKIILYRDENNIMRCFVNWVLSNSSFSDLVSITLNSIWRNFENWNSQDKLISVAWYNRKLSDTEIKNIYNRTKNLFSDNNPQWSNIWFGVKGWLTVDKIKALNLPTSDTW